jgi:hypothetical protein
MYWRTYERHFMEADATMRRCHFEFSAWANKVDVHVTRLKKAHGAE